MRLQRQSIERLNFGNDAFATVEVPRENKEGRGQKDEVDSETKGTKRWPANQGALSQSRKTAKLHLPF